MNQKPLDPNSERYVIVGKLGKSYGIHGWLKVQSFTTPHENLLGYNPWYIDKQNQWVPLDLTGVKDIGNVFIAKINHVDSPEQAKYYTNLSIAIHQSQLPALAEGEYYWKDLTGLTVHTTTGTCLGKVDYIFDSGAHPIIVVNGEKEHLIPYIKDQFIVSINIAQQNIVVDWDSNFL